MSVSLIPKRIGPKMFVAFLLASAIPALTFLYLLTSPMKALGYIGFVIAITLWIILLGYHLATSIVRSVKDLTTQAQALAMGDLKTTIKLEREEELARLAASFNKLAQMVSDATKNVQTSVEGLKVKDRELEKKLRIMEEEPFLDRETGLYNEGYIKRRLNEEVKRAILYQRPCSFVIFSVDDYNKILAERAPLQMKFVTGQGDKEGLKILKEVASSISGSISEIDIPGRLSHDSMGLILPDRSKQKAYELAERIRAAVQSKGAATLSCGVSENPIDGVSGDEILKKAQANVESAKAQGGNKVIT